MRATRPILLPIVGPAAPAVGAGAPSSAGPKPTPPGASGGGPESGRAREWRGRR
jgi:hypothetical protein